MRIKKKELRKRQAQLPINYPDPEVQPEAVPGAGVDLQGEMVQVEILSKRLAHNEVAVRDAVLAELAQYLRRLTQPMAVMEKEYAAEMAAVRAFYSTHPAADKLYAYDNLPLALHQYRVRAHAEATAARRREAVRALKQRHAEEEAQRARRGRFDETPSTNDEPHVSEESDDARYTATAAGQTPAHTTREASVRAQRYQRWVQAWCDLELVLLKLCRGIHFCLWHSDKPLVQLACAQQIAQLLHAPATTRCKLLFYSALFRVLSREWPTIDRYRLDKYLALVRKMLYELFVLLRQQEEEEGKEAVMATPESLHIAASHTPELKRPRTNSNGDAECNDDEDCAATKKTKKKKAAQSGKKARRQSHRLVVDTIAASCIDTHYSQTHPSLARTLHALSYLFHRQLIPCAQSVGMTMHIADVVFDELCRACLSPQLFITLTVCIPLYAMSQGNYVEKRVLDNFFPQIACGVLLQRRTEQAKAAEEATRRAAVGRPKRSRDVEVDEASAAAEVHGIVAGIAQYCQQFAVARDTVPAVRVMFSEAELVLRQTLQPDAFETVNALGQRRRLEREIDEVNATRRAVKEARDVRRTLRRRKDAAEGSRGEQGSESATGRNIKRGKKKAPTRNTKRKKDYQLTKEDLYGDIEDEHEDEM